jgi:hypothetical protein
MNAQDEQQQTSQSAAYNPFPEPQTIPSGWDLSELTPIAQNDLEMAEDSSD